MFTGDADKEPIDVPQASPPRRDPRDSLQTVAGVALSAASRVATPQARPAVPALDLPIREDTPQARPAR